MTDINLLEHQPIAWTPTPDIIERAQLTKFMRQVGVSTWDELYQYSIRNVEKFTEEVIKFLDIRFDPPYDTLLDTSGGIEFPKWFTRSEGPRASSPFGLTADEGVRVPTAGLNITTMCLDRWQTDEMKDQPAVIWEEEGGEATEKSYAELLNWVEYCASGLIAIGIKAGDAVGIHLPMTFKTVVALLGINRIGAIAVPVFSGYGVEAIASRLNAVDAKALFTCDGFSRRGRFFDALEIAHQAVLASPTIEHIFVCSEDPKFDLRQQISDKCFVELEDLLSWGPRFIKHPPQPTSAEDPLIILYTSGTTGRPKGIAHTHASFPIKAAQDMAFGTDVGRGTRICWYTDIGWMMGAWLIYGALINGATICIYDGAPDYPTPDRMWEFCAKHKVEILGISPTLVRALAAHEEGGGEDTSARTEASAASADFAASGDADEGVRVPSSVRVPPYGRHDLSSLRAFASTGEPWNPAPWWWLFEKVGNGKIPIINYSGGTEIAGGILMGNPLLPQKPCSFPAPCPGMDVDILDENGQSVGPNQVGELVIKQPWIGMARGFWQEKERYLETYWSRFKNIWVHGDWAMRDSDGHWFILGRSDDTLKVAGKRVGPAEIESLLVAHPLVAEAAVIGVPDEKKGTAMVAFCVLRNADAPVRNEGEARTTAATFANKKGWHERGYLHHFDGVVAQFVTFRLADSLPQSMLRRLKQEIESGDIADASKEFRKRVEEHLDKGIGECILRNPEVAEIVQDTLLNEHGRSYKLIAWTIMPNHVHVLLFPLQGHSLSSIIKSIKSISSHKINKKLDRTGRIWQPDYFDRYIRDAEHFVKTVRYIENNPVKAGLCGSPGEWPFSSASPRAAIADEGVRVPLEEELCSLVARDMGKPLAPSKIHFVTALPKTRNAKVMRRVIRAAYLGEDAGDLSPLENPHAIEEIGRTR
jgi:acetyl-CoA synthetase